LHYKSRSRPAIVGKSDGADKFFNTKHKKLDRSYEIM
jgi:hypothetical protein